MTTATWHTIDQQQLVCPRCGSGLAVAYDELECLICGYVDYSWTPPNAQPRRSKMDRDVRFRLPYVGDFRAMQGSFILVQLDRTTNRQPLVVSCPFCGDRMVETSLTCSGKGLREERYICRESHRVSMMRDRDGGLGWR